MGPKIDPGIPSRPHGHRDEVARCSDGVMPPPRGRPSGRSPLEVDRGGSGAGRPEPASSEPSQSASYGASKAEVSFNSAPEAPGSEWATLAPPFGLLPGAPPPNQPPPSGAELGADPGSRADERDRSEVSVGLQPERGSLLDLSRIRGPIGSGVQFGGPCGVAVGSMWRRSGVASGPVWGRHAADSGSLWGRCRIDLGSVWGRSVAGPISGPFQGRSGGRSGLELGSRWGRVEIDLESILGRCGVATRGRYRASFSIGSGSIEGRCGVGLGWISRAMCDRFGVGLVSMWCRCGVDVVSLW